MLYILNVYSIIGQLYLNKTGVKTYDFVCANVQRKNSGLNQPWRYLSRDIHT